MKKLIIVAAAIATLATTTIAVGASQGIYWGVPTYNHHNLYAETMIVHEADAENVVFEDSNGFLWETTNDGDWEVGDFAGIIIDDNGTQLIFDDIILAAKYQNLTNWIE